ncbi:acyltransferase family protein [Bacillus pumilus]|uniref:acyltransferase family protein n=1 Tax=Bacillus pumilus TaxID=1408 RepID=UPI0011E8B823|nr:acyltransferase family protein [Bacillus pumilus]TYS31308.1 acetyltransferase [Bacillus pumilus]TYS46457.1 acetyltransferase [Bacillus pumilus]
MNSKENRLRYILGLDGLRAIAVLAVIAYHLHIGPASGGFLGVDLFFVISGYLITTILLHKQDLGYQELLPFWMGRIRRLLPAAYVMIFLTVSWCAIAGSNALLSIRGDALSSFFYVSNWWYIFHQLSYFDSFNAISPLKNLWSLAIEEQFYIIWPVLLIAGLKWVKNRSHLPMITFGLALVSALWMAILYSPDTDPSRVYYGTDTRAFALLIGCTLAFVWPMQRLSSKKLLPVGRRILHIAGFGSFAVFLLCVYAVDEFDGFLYQGGILLFCFNAAILIACISHPASLLGKWLSYQPLVWLGKRSYGIYLWHYPIIVLTTPVIEIGQPSMGRVALQLIAILLIAEASYRFIEQPIRKLGFRQYFASWSIWKKGFKQWSTSHKVFLGIAVALLILFTIGMSSSSHKSPHAKEVTQIKTAPKKAGDSSESNAKKKKEKHEKKAADQKQFQQVLAVGDSVMLDIAPNLEKAYAQITIDAKVGRQMNEAVSIAPQYASFNQSNAAVIIELGTNGYFTEGTLTAFIQKFSKAHIFLVNTRVPRSWENDVNAVIQRVADQHANVTLVDWHSAATGQPSYFQPDGVHLSTKGSDTLTQLISASIKKKGNVSSSS